MAGTWQRLAHAVLGSDGDTFDTGTFTAKNNLKIIVWTKGTTGGTYQGIRFNDDTGSNYAHRRSEAGSSDGTNTSTNFMQLSDSDIAHGGGYTVTYITNISDKEKLAITHSVMGSSSGAGTAPDRDEFVGKWANTSAQITKIQVYNQGSGNFVAGSWITVLGASDDIVTDEKTTITDIPTGTRYEETDTRKIYRRKAGATGVDVPTNAGWSADTTDISTSSSGVAFSFDSSSINETVYYDLQNANVLNGSNLNNSKWTLRGKLVFTTNTANGTAANAFDVRVVLHASTSFSGETPNGDGIWWLWGNRSSNGIYQYLYSRDGSSSAIQTSVTDAGSVGANTWYFEISRTGDTTVTFKLFTDSAFSTQSGSTVSITGASSDVDDLRYLHVSGFSQTVSSPGNMTGTISELKIYDDAIPSEIDPSWVERNTV